MSPARAARAALRLSAAALAVVAPCPASALDPARSLSQYTLQVWRTEDGLPQDSLTAIAQTTDGALWIGTPSGLVRFDGSEFRQLAFPHDWPPATRYINALLAGTGGELWAATRGELLHLDRGELRRFGVPQGVPVGGAQALAADAAGTLLLGTGEGVLRLAGDRAVPVPLVGDRPALPGAIAVAALRGGGFVAGGEAGVLAVGAAGARLYTTGDGLPSNLLNAILEGRDGRVWLGTSLGLAVLADGRVFVPEAVRALRGRWIRCLLEDRDGNLWIGLRGGGAFRLRGDRLDTFDQANGLPDNLVRQIVEDNDGGIWFVTAGGLARLMDGAVTVWGPPEGLPAPFVWSVLATSAAELLIGTSGSGLARLAAAGFAALPSSHPALAGVEIRALLEDVRGGVWIGTGGNGVVEVRSGRSRRLGMAEGLPAAWVYCLLEDRAGTIWVGTGAGLARVAGGAVVEVLRSAASRPAAAIVRSLAEDAHGTVWVGTGAGVARVESGVLAPVAAAAPLADARIHCVLPEADGTIWLAGDSGLARLRDGRLQLVGGREGLPNEMLYWLLDDGAGTLWVSSDVGILRLPKAQVDELERGERQAVEPLVVNRADGMRGTECNSGHPAGARRADGALCFATTNGVACVDPVRLRWFETAPRVEIAEVHADGQSLPVAPGGAAAPLAVALPPGTRRLEVRFAAIALAAPERVVFRFRLEGFDPGWVEASRTRAAQFTGLPPGSYRFVVQARGGNGPWTAGGAALAVEVRPAFHQTRPFLALLALAAVLAVVGAWRLRTRQLRHRERRLRELVEQRTRDLAAATGALGERTRALEQANAELERLSLLDPLTRIANRRQLDARLDSEWRRGARSGTTLSLVLCDIDHFKAYNDACGHPAGDACLRAVARALARTAQRTEDLVARYGGEEFAVLLPGLDEGECAAMAERLRHAVESQAIPHPRSSAADHVTVSLGCATMRPATSVDVGALVAAADRALYAAKADGRNRVAVAAELP